jgi:hypothetical protein
LGTEQALAHAVNDATGVTSIKGILCTLTICWRRIQRSSKSKNCPKPHYGRENDRFHDLLQTAKWLGSRAWTCPTSHPKTNAPNNGGAFRAINAPPQTLNAHKFSFIEVPRTSQLLGNSWTKSGRGAVHPLTCSLLLGIANPQKLDPSAG